MEEIAKYINISLDELILIIAFTVIIIGVAIIIFIMLFRFNKSNKYINKLSNVLQKSNNKSLMKNPIINTITHIFPKNDECSNDTLIQKIINYTKDDYKNYNIHIHLTPTKAIAGKILDEGFKFLESLYKTSQELKPDIVDLRYKLLLYKQYGKYLVFIYIPKELHNHINDEIIINKKEILVEMALSSKIDEEDFNYLLPPVFIRGFVDIEKKEIINNKKFLEGYDLAKYKEKVNLFLKH